MRAAAALPPARAVVAPEDGPTYRVVADWLRRHLPGQRYPKPVCKRLAVAVSGLLVQPACTLGSVAAAVVGLDVSEARAESVERRLRRALADDRLDPAHLLPVLFAAVLPTVLAPLVARRGTAGRLVVVVDETSHTDRVHLLVAGLAYRGFVVPLGLRAWVQNEPLPEGAYRLALQALLTEVRALLPAALRDRVLVVADRAYATPWLLDLLTVLGWGWVLRVQGQTRVLLRDGRALPVDALAPRPGTAWLGHHDPTGPPLRAAPTAVAGVFKAAGWRRSQVAAVWAPGAPAPWLLLTSLRPSRATLLAYARRWGIERLFLAWKSHGWDMEACGIHDPARLARLGTALVVATLWRLAAGVADAAGCLRALRARAAAAPDRAIQLRLPLDAPPGHLARPYCAKRSLFTRGADTWARINGAREHPDLLWAFPDWHAPTWSRQATQAALDAR